MDCASCGHPNASDAKFCGNCGEPLSRLGQLPELRGLEPGRPEVLQRLWRSARRSAERGGPADEGGSPPQRTVDPPDHLAAKIRAGGAAMEGERKQVTVLFADVMGSMELAERCDPEEWRQIMDRFFAILCEGVHLFEGTVDKFTGDGIMALFGAPIAHEDHAQRACFAALRLIDELAEFTAELRRTKGLNFLGPDGPQLRRGGGRRDRRGPRDGVHRGRPHRRPRAAHGAARRAGQGLPDRAHRRPRRRATWRSPTSASSR